MIHRQSFGRRSSRAVVFAMSCSFLVPAASAFAGECGGLRSGRPVPQTRSEMGPNEFLWPRNLAGDFTFRPVSNSSGNPLPIPVNRDSTSYITQTIPGNQSGHELFMDVAALEGNDDWVFVAYNAGVQVWDLRSDPSDPDRAVFRDGWLGQFQEFPAAGEVDTYIEDIDVVESNGDIFIGLVGRSGHGFSFWEFTPPNNLTQRCQFTSHVARQVELIHHNNRAYAFVSASDGLFVYDLTSSSGGNCFLEGKVGTMTDGNYVSVLQKDGEVFVAAADGSLLVSDPLGVEIWKLNPELPEGAQRLFSGFNSNSRAVNLFEIPGAVSRYFLGVVEGSSNLEFYDVEACLEHTGPGNCSLGPMLANQPVDNIGKLYEFLDVSRSSDGRTWGYYGFMTSPGLFGSKFEYLLDLTPLASVSLQDAESLGGISLSEITDGGDTYNNSAPCTNTAPVDYWGDYYTRSRHGLNFLIPRHGIFIGNKFYRAAYSMFDIHEIVNVAPVSSIDTDLDGGSTNRWLDETATFSGTPGGSCSPSAGNWCWVVETSGTDLADSWSHVPDLGDCSASYTNPESFDFSCVPGTGKTRCDNGSAIVSGWNTSCGSFPPDNNQSSSVTLTLKDPTVDIDGALDTGGTTTYQQCQIVPLNADLAGRGPITWEWQLDGEPLDGCSGSVSNASDLVSVNTQCLWDTSGVQLNDEIFVDLFESGDLSLWNDLFPPPTFGGTKVRAGHRASRGVTFAKGGGIAVQLPVELVVSNGGVLDTESETITVEEIGVPAFVNVGNEVDVVVSGNAATLTAPATDTSSWVWEIEDPVAGTSTCSFDATALCVTEETFVGTFAYAWTLDGTYDIQVSISNCLLGGSESASGSATVSAAVTPVINGFRFNPSATEVCCGSPFAGFECQSGVEIEFEVEMFEEAASYGFGFDWERTSQASANYQSQAPDGNVLGLYTFTHTFANSGATRTVFPIVQVTSGLNADTEDFYTSDGAITILPNGQTCN